MHHFEYRDSVLHCEDISVSDIAERFGTPVYIYSSATLTRHYNVLTDAFKDQPCLIAYAMKANSNQAVLATLAALGSGADVVSGGEMKRAIVEVPVANLPRWVHLCGSFVQLAEPLLVFFHLNVCFSKA